MFPEIASALRSNPLPGWLVRLLRRWRDASRRAARMNVVVGHRMQEYFAAQKIAADRLCVIDNWADPAAVVPKPASASALGARLGLSGRFVVCYSGNLGRAHEYQMLLGAAEILRGDPSFAFLMIGGGAKMQLLREAVAQRGLEHFIFLSYQAREELSDSLAARMCTWQTCCPSSRALWFRASSTAFWRPPGPWCSSAMTTGKLPAYFANTPAASSPARVRATLTPRRCSGCRRIPRNAPPWARARRSSSIIRGMRPWRGGRQSSTLNRRTVAAPLCLQHLQVDEHLVAGAHPAVREPRAAVEKA